MGARFDKVKRAAGRLAFWRKRLAEATGPKGPALAWDLSGVDPEDLDPGETGGTDPRRLIRLRPLAAGCASLARPAAAGKGSPATFPFGGREVLRYIRDSGAIRTRKSH